MFLDAQNLFSDAQAITATANSTNVIDTSVVRDIGSGEDIYLFLTVTTAFTDSGSDSTLAVTLATDDNASLSSPATVRTLVTFPALTAAGTTLYFKLEPEQLVAFQRYIGLVYTPAGGNLTTGAITAGLVRGIQQDRKYASGFTVS